MKVKVDPTYADQIWKLTIDSPPGNILDMEMIKGLREQVHLARQEKDLKAVVLAGAGKNFSYGASIEEHEKTKVARFLQEFHGLFLDLMELETPIMAVVQGHCLGGGLELAAFSSWIFASDTSDFGLPEIKLGVFPPIASLLLPEKIGQTQAESLILTGRTIRAQEAQTMGLISCCVSAEKLENAVRSFIEEEIEPKSSVALRYSYRAVRTQLYKTLQYNISVLEGRYLNDLMNTKDANEGIAAFLEKRPPAWKHR